MERWRRVAAVLLGACLLAAPARAEEEASTAYVALVGVGSALSTLVYSPVKLVYATAGLVVTSFAFLLTFGDTDVAGQLFETTVGGDYVITPAHLEGRRDLRFRGGS